MGDLQVTIFQYPDNLFVLFSLCKGRIEQSIGKVYVKSDFQRTRRRYFKIDEER